MGHNVKKNWFVTTFIVGSLIFCSWAFFHYEKRLNLSNISILKTIRGEKSNEQVKCATVLNIGKQGLLSMEMVIPCEDEDQVSDLTSKLHIIKSDFLTSLDQIQIDKWVKEGNLRAIKAEFLKIVNRHIDKPVENLYFESFISK